MLERFYLCVFHIGVVTFPFHPRPLLVETFPLTCRRHFVFGHHTFAVVLLAPYRRFKCHHSSNWIWQNAVVPSVHPSILPAGRPAPWPSLASCLSSCCLPSQACRQPKLRWRQMLWMTDSPGEQEEGKTKWGSDCWQGKYNNPTVSETCGASEGSAIFKSNACEEISWFSPRWSFSQKPELFFFWFFSGATVILPWKKHFRIPPIISTIVTRCRTKQNQWSIIGKSNKRRTNMLWSK